MQRPSDPAPEPSAVLATPQHRNRLVLRSIGAGVVAAAVALGVGELVAGFRSRWTSPVVGVAEATIDRVPRPIKDFGIRTFGGDDKLALIIGILLTSFLFAVVLGLVSRRHRRIASLGLVGFALVGGWASQQLTGARAGDVLPSLAAGAAGVGSLLALRRAAGTPTVDPVRAATEPAPDRSESHEAPRIVWSGDPADGPAPTSEPFDGSGSRRRFLATAGVLVMVAGGAASAGRALRARFSAARSRDEVALPPVGAPLPQASPSIAVDVPGALPFFTPNDTFYRVDTAVDVPQVPADTWTLRVTGMVDREIEISFAELLERELVEEDITLTCVSNTVGGSLVGTARWLGLPIQQLLDEAGVSPDADQIVGRSVDGYTCGFPVAALDGRPALLAVGMNGEPLPIAHGFPARLIVAGLYGYVSATKWVTELEVTRFDRFDQYWVERGWDEQAPIKTMARIDTPRSLGKLQAGANIIAGVAWAQTIGIGKVEVSIDDGPFVEAELADEQNVNTWRQWKLDWDAPAGRHRITARATDADGQLQTDQRAEPFPNGASGWMSIFVDVQGAP